MKINLTLPFFVFIFSSVFCAGAVAKPVRVTSYERNFIITAPSHQLANSLAADCEKFREMVLRKFGWKQSWQNPIEFFLVKDIAGTKRELIRIGDDLSYRVIIPARGNYFWKTIVPEIVRFTVLNQTQIKKAKPFKKLYDNVPYWLIKGIIYYCDPETETVYENLARGSIFEGKYIPASELFKIKSVSKTAEKDNIIGCQSAFVVDFLIHLEKGKERFNTFVSSLNDSEEWRCVFEDIYFIDFKTAEELNGLLIHSLHDPDRISFSGQKIEFKNSLELLNYAMAVKVTDQDNNREESKYIIDLKRFKTCCKAEIARRKLMDAYPVLIKLKFEGDEKLLPVVEKYLNASIMWKPDNLKNFWNAFCEAEKERKKLL